MEIAIVVLSIVVAVLLIGSIGLALDYRTTYISRAAFQQEARSASSHVKVLIQENNSLRTALDSHVYPQRKVYDQELADMEAKGL